LDGGIESFKQSRWWKDLRNVCGVGIEGMWLNENIKWDLGPENKVLFWEDKWLGHCTLKDKYPRLYINSYIKDITVSMAGEWRENLWD